MHLAFGIYLIISIEILAITAILHFVLKAVKEGAGGFIKWIAYITLVAGFLILLCTFTQGIMKMVHRGDGNDMKEMHGWYGGHHMMMGGGCCGGSCCGGGCGDGCEEDEKCDMKKDKCCEGDSMKMNMKDHHMMMHKDSMMKNK